MTCACQTADHLSAPRKDKELIGTLRKAVKDGDGNVGKTIKLITERKKD